MSLRAQALREFDLPTAPQRIDELPPGSAGSDLFRVHAPAGRFLMVFSARALDVAFEATLFDLLAEARFPAPRPRRAKSGSLIAQLEASDGVAAAACYAWPPGEELSPALATLPQLLEIGRLLGRLHDLAEAHPASVPDCDDAASLLARLPAGLDRDALAPALGAAVPPLPTGAVHGGLRPVRALFVGDRCSAVLPSGMACSASLLLDLAEAALGWMLGADRPSAVLRAIVSGYQSLRRLSPEEKDALYGVLRFAAARDGARRSIAGRAFALNALKTVDFLGEAEIRSVAGG